jgi:hypothetical protein
VRTASITPSTHPWWWRQYAPLKHRSTIILHGSTTQKTALNICLWLLCSCKAETRGNDNTSSQWAVTCLQTWSAMPHASRHLIMVAPTLMINLKIWIHNLVGRTTLSGEKKITFWLRWQADRITDNDGKHRGPTAKCEVRTTAGNWWRHLYKLASFTDSFVQKSYWYITTK